MPIKVYDNTRIRQEGLQYKLEKMETLFVHNQEQGEVPHRHEYYTLLLVEKAKGKHIIDFNTYELEKYQLYCVAPGQVHQIIEDCPSKGYVMLFTPQFLIQHHIDTRFLEDLDLFRCSGDASPVSLKLEEWQQLHLWMVQMDEACQLSFKYHEEAVASYLKLILIYTASFHAKEEQNTQLQTSAYRTLKQFKDTLERNFKNTHHAQVYADELHISADYLGRVLRDLTGTSTKGHIQARLLLEAKRLLFFSDESLKEIAFSLGFQEAAHFSAFFKKMTRKSPTQFRKENGK